MRIWILVLGLLVGCEAGEDGLDVKAREVGGLFTVEPWPIEAVGEPDPDDDRLVVADVQLVLRPLVEVVYVTLPFLPGDTVPDPCDEPGTAFVIDGYGGGGQPLADRGSWTLTLAVCDAPAGLGEIPWRASTDGEAWVDASVPAAVVAE